MGSDSALANQTILVTGGSGLLGNAIVETLPNDAAVTATYNSAPLSTPDAEYKQLDLREQERIAPLLEDTDPNLIFHCAAITNLDYCEHNPDTAFEVNTAASETLAAWASQHGADFVYISTDAVYGGEQSFSQETDQLRPENVYAETKADAERRVRRAHEDPLIVRTTIHGLSPGEKTSLSEWIYETLAASESISLFEDAHFSPLYAPDLAELLVETVIEGETGTYNFAAPERLSKLAFGQLLAKVFELPSDLITLSKQADFGFDAPRPHDISLSVEKARRELGLTFPSVEAGLERMQSDLQR